MLTYGNATRPTLIYTTEAHKLHLAFTVAAGVTVRRTQPVKFNNAGEVTPLAQGDNRNLCIGISMHDGNAGDEVTIIMKGYATILAKASAAVNAGPVSYEGYESEVPAAPASTLPDESNVRLWGTNLVQNAAATDADILGHAIEQGAEDDLIKVVVLG